MTAEYCTEECVSASMPLSELFPCRARAQEDKDPPRAAELFYEAGLAIAVPLVIAFLITFGTGMTVASVP